MNVIFSNIYLLIIISMLYVKKLIFNNGTFTTNDWETKEDLYKSGFDSRSPQHISLMSNEKGTRDLDFISSFINNALFTGIRQLSFCGQLMNSAADVLCNIRGKELKNDNNKLKLNESKEIKANKARLIDSCKMFSKFKNELMVEDVENFLYGSDEEVDFFIIIGSNFHINYGSFPIWALRTAELHSFSNCQPLSTFQYCSLINNFNQRQRRFGR